MADNSNSIRVEGGPFHNAIVPHLPYDYEQLATNANKNKALNVLMAVHSMKWRADDDTTPICLVEVGKVQFKESVFTLLFFGFKGEPSPAKKDELRRLLVDISIYSICYNAIARSKQLYNGEYLLSCLQIDVSMAGIFSPTTISEPPIIVVDAPAVVEAHSRKRTHREDEEDYIEVATTCKRPSIRDCAETVLDQCSLFGRLFNRFVNISTAGDIIDEGDDDIVT